jgi:hypothetical protein
MCTTPALGQGFHRDNVKHVILFRGAYSFLGYKQIVGRMGRTGAVAHSWLVLSEKGPNSFSRSKPDLFSKDFAHPNSRDCLRRRLAEEIDGPAFAFKCRDLPGSELCSICDPSTDWHQLGKHIMQEQDLDDINIPDSLQPFSDQPPDCPDATTAGTTRPFKPILAAFERWVLAERLARSAANAKRAAPGPGVHGFRQEPLDPEPDEFDLDPEIEALIADLPSSTLDVATYGGA